MAVINQPPSDAVDSVDANGALVAPKEGWRNFFQQVFTVCNAASLSGTTAQRPTTLLWVGRPFFDTTLNRPIWYAGTNWIKADGTVV